VVRRKFDGSTETKGQRGKGAKEKKKGNLKLFKVGKKIA
jgi:hypothetical protein